MKRGIEINSLSRSFGGIRAVDAIDLKVRHNTIFGLIGPDGAGKTTLMRMLCSLMKPDSGTAQIGGLDIRTQGDEIINHLGYMPQRFSLYGDLTVMENLRFYSDIYQVPADVREEKIEYLLEFSRLKKHSDKLAAQLPRGMKQKLTQCSKLIHTTEFLMLDEPTTGVDPVARKELWKILFDLRDQGVTILISTPYMDEAQRCDEIGLIDSGRIIARDTPENIINSFEKHIICIYSSDNYRARDTALMQECVEDAYLLGEELHIVVSDHEAAYEELEKALASAGTEIQSMEKIRPSLEDVFVSMIKGQKREGGV